jgi:hypothetical protein
MKATSCCQAKDCECLSRQLNPESIRSLVGSNLEIDLEQEGALLLEIVLTVFVYPGTW